MKIRIIREKGIIRNFEVEKGKEIIEKIKELDKCKEPPIFWLERLGGNPLVQDQGNEKMECEHDYVWSNYCGAYVCKKCGHHKGLAKCFCGWSKSGELNELDRWEFEHGY
ncbi:hypothetical protein DRO51_01480 [Candidatus Bathyarchaeota archaeon]|nr:MAG: hypothetical protein DRO51_01480 [Candidatus Bathyarchaeota archaeon]